MPSRAFGEYEVLARLATGGAANIFLARHARFGVEPKLVCLKTLLPERARDKEFVAMFLDEARIAQRLMHPNCIELFEVGQIDGTYFIAMEAILGETLWGLLSTVPEVRRPLPPEVVASIVARVCVGLHHAHELKDEKGRPLRLIHRDISPQNVMITFEGQTKVLDFGIAKAATEREATVTGIVKGKFAYMSPEQITGASIDHRSDLYSLGIVMFECLASRRLYRADNPEQIARMMFEPAPRLKDAVPDIHPELDAICAKALSRQPARRFQSAKEMGDAITAHLSNVKFDPGTRPVMALMEERFSDRISARRLIYEKAARGEYEESELLRVLGARPVLELDLLPDPGDDLLYRAPLISGQELSGKGLLSGEKGAMSAAISEVPRISVAQRVSEALRVSETPRVSEAPRISKTPRVSEAPRMHRPSVEPAGEDEVSYSGSVVISALMLGLALGLLIGLLVGLLLWT